MLSEPEIDDRWQSELEKDIDAKHLAQLLSVRAKEHVFGVPEQIKLVIAALLVGGHVLLQDVPGVGKTSLAKSVASALGGSFRRIQGAADLLPSDIVGTSVYNPINNTWEIRPGPVFSNVLLIDEIGQLPPRAQSALLEAMEERTATLDGVPRPLPDPHWIIATRNPTSMGGYPLAEPLADRFLITVSLGYPPATIERAMITGKADTTLDPASMPSLCSPKQLATAQAQVASIKIADNIAEYIVAVCDATRRCDGIIQGASPRAVLATASLSRAVAVLSGRDYVVPDDAQAAIRAALPHRLQSSNTDPITAIEQLLADTPVPRRI